MADEFQLGSGNWWEASRNRFENGTSVHVPISTTLNTVANFGGLNVALQGGNEQSDGSGGGGGGGVILDNPNLQMMGLCLSSQGMDWNQALLGEKAESSFHSMIQEDMNSNTSSFQQETPITASSHDQQWRHKIYNNSGGASSDDSSANEFKQMNRGFSLDQQPQFNSQATSNDSTITSNAAYGLLLSENQPAYENRPTNYAVYPPSSSYGANAADWNKFPQFLRSSPPKQVAPGSSHLHFTNNTPFWNASSPVNDKSSFFPALHNRIPAASSFDEKPKMTSEIRDMGRTMSKKNSTEMSSKRPRNETPSPLPAFKVRKEKMGDRITALQQLVSPFGKTDTASVLSEAIEYIKFLHEQVSVLSTPYMKNGGPIQHQQNSDKSNLDPEGPRQDLGSRGLCLVPVSSTFPVTHETMVDFWTPTFGGTFR